MRVRGLISVMALAACSETAPDAPTLLEPAPLEGPEVAVPMPTHTIIGEPRHVVEQAPGVGLRPAAAISRVVLELVGEATIDGERASAGTPLGQRFRLRASRGAHGYLSLGRDHVLELREARLSADGAEYILHEGTAWLATAGAVPFELRAGPLVVSGHGGMVFVEATSARTAYVCVCEGQVELRPRGGKTPSKRIEGGAHQAFNARKKGKRLVLTPAKRRDHFEAEKVVLLERLGQRLGG